MTNYPTLFIHHKVRDVADDFIARLNLVSKDGLCALQVNFDEFLLCTPGFPFANSSCQGE